MRQRAFISACLRSPFLLRRALLGALLLTATSLQLFVLAPEAYSAGVSDTSSEDISHEDASALTWPLLPGESLQSLARLFYPDNTAMQSHFVKASLQLSQDLHPDLTAQQTTEYPRTIRIPELKSLSRHSTSAKPEAQRSPKPEPHTGISPQLSPSSIATVLAEMWADYEALSKENLRMATDLNGLHSNIANLEYQVTELNRTVSEWMAKQKTAATTVSTTAPRVFKQVSTEQAPLNAQPAASEHHFMDSLTNQRLLLIPALLLLLLLMYWVRRRRAPSFDGTQLESSETLHVSPIIITDIPPTIPMKTEMVVEEHEPEAHEEVVEPAPRETIGVATEETPAAPPEESPVELEKPSHLLKYAETIPLLKVMIESEPKASVTPWLSLLEAYRDTNDEAAFNDLADDMHQTFNVIAPTWLPAKAAVVIPESLEEFPHLITQITEAWQNGTVEELFDTLLFDKRDGEREGFSLNVIKEIGMLQAVWRLRDLATEETTE